MSVRVCVPVCVCVCKCDAVFNMVWFVQVSALVQFHVNDTVTSLSRCVLGTHGPNCACLPPHA
jgi:hypothetical protein